MRHAAHMNESCPSYMNESCCTGVFEWLPQAYLTPSNVASQECFDANILGLRIWRQHIWLATYSTNQWFMSHIWMSNITNVNESCHEYEWVMLHRGFRVAAASVFDAVKSCKSRMFRRQHSWPAHLTPHEWSEEGLQHLLGAINRALTTR